MLLLITHFINLAAKPIAANEKPVAAETVESTAAEDNDDNAEPSSEGKKKKKKHKSKAAKAAAAASTVTIVDPNGPPALSIAEQFPNGK